MMTGKGSTRLRPNLPAVTPPPSSAESVVGISSNNDDGSIVLTRNNNTTTKRRRGTSTKARKSHVFVRKVLSLLICGIGIVLVGLCFIFVFLVPETGSTEEVTESFVDRGERLGGKRPVLPSDLRLATLTTCQAYGLAFDEETMAAAAQEMVYWQTIPTDYQYQSPFFDGNASPQRYLTFALDGGGFNNVRMSLETVVTMAHAMGRILVLPPAQEVYLLDENSGTKTQQPQFRVEDFFPMHDIAARHEGLDIITMEEFLIRQGLTGHLKDSETGRVSFPPHNNRTHWDGDTNAVTEVLEPWLESVAYMPDWNPETCMAAFPMTRDPDDATSLFMRYQGVEIRGGFPDYARFVGNPTKVYADPFDRLAEDMNGRTNLCIYDNSMVHEPLIHFHGKIKWEGRLLVQFYSFLFFENWRQDLWTKRFVRDNLRYKDELQCAAARVVAAIRDRARERNPTNTDNSINAAGDFDAFHVRRGEFQYKKTRVSAREIYEISQDQIPEGATVFVATDERQKKLFFSEMAEHYDLVYLDDFAHLLDGIDTNYYGMIDQLVASRARTFFGCWFST